jgi:membrane protein YqaA with SNARE-associated domain
VSTGNKQASIDVPVSPPADEVSVLRWFIGYAAALVAALAGVALLLGEQGWQGEASLSGVAEAMRAMSPTAKLLVFAMYISVCTTFLPLPTGAVVAAMATREAAVAGSLASTTLLVATVGAGASTVANLNDYHLFTWLLRSRHVAKVRGTKVYDASAKWFARQPFFLLVVFNIIPIPVDVIRLLAITYRYPRGKFAAANLIGRFIRYGVIAAVTYWLSSWRKDAGWIAVLVLLGVAVALGLSRLVPKLVAKIRPGPANG